jgi:hypothetical protein
VLWEARMAESRMEVGARAAAGSGGGEEQECEEEQEESIGEVGVEMGKKHERSSCGRATGG